jgi:4-methyl-5(b-hydroxyethyl)-thiazole monophosphate biosynthesis
MAADPKRVLVPVADGCEEMEAVIVIDVLVRAGASVTVASVDGPTVTCSRGVKLQADRLVADVASETFDLIAVPVWQITPAPLFLGTVLFVPSDAHAPCKEE